MNYEQFLNVKVYQNWHNGMYTIDFSFQNNCYSLDFIKNKENNFEATDVYHFEDKKCNLCKENMEKDSVCGLLSFQRDSILEYFENKHPIRLKILFLE